METYKLPKVVKHGTFYSPASVCDGGGYWGVKRDGTLARIDWSETEEVSYSFFDREPKDGPHKIPEGYLPIEEIGELITETKNA